MAGHHPDRKAMPTWVLDVGNQIFHKTVTICQRMLPNAENVTVIHNLIMALEFEYLVKRAVLDMEEGIGQDTAAVRKAVAERIKREAEDHEF
jgi:hypothetical protein